MPMLWAKQVKRAFGISKLADVAKNENIGEVNDWPELTSICIGSAMEKFHSSSGLINCPSRLGTSALRESADLPNWGASLADRKPIFCERVFMNCGQATKASTSGFCTSLQANPLLCFHID